jgi:hypothetical protein
VSNRSDTLDATTVRNLLNGSTYAAEAARTGSSMWRIRRLWQVHTNYKSKVVCRRSERWHQRNAARRAIDMRGVMTDREIAAELGVAIEAVRDWFIGHDGRVSEAKARLARGRIVTFKVAPAPVVRTIPGDLMWTRARLLMGQRLTAAGFSAAIVARRLSADLPGPTVGLQDVNARSGVEQWARPTPARPRMCA